MGGAPSVILPGLWLGGQDYIEEEGFFNEASVGHVLSLGPAHPPQHIQLSSREHINVQDASSADLSRHFARVVRYIAKSRHSAEVDSLGIYVHCAAGISRS